MVSARGSLLDGKHPYLQRSLHTFPVCARRYCQRRGSLELAQSDKAELKVYFVFRPQEGQGWWVEAEVGHLDGRAPSDGEPFAFQFDCRRPGRRTRDVSDL